MITKKLLNKNLLILGIPVLLFISVIVLIKSPVFIVDDRLNLAITLDLLLTIPLVYYLLIRKTKIPKTTVVPILIIGLVIGNATLPEAHQKYIQLFAVWVLPFIELTIASFIIYKIRKGVKRFKQMKGTSPDFMETLREVCKEILPEKVIPAFCTEFAMFYYGFYNWKKRELGPDEFSYHQKTGTQALMGAFIFVIVIEVIAIHFLLLQWSEIAAWILTGLSIYTALQVFGAARSLSKRPIAIDDQFLTLRYGILNEVRIPLSDIIGIENTKKEFEKNDLARTLSPIGDMEGVNLILKTKHVHTLKGLYGFKKNFTTLGLHLDEPDKFRLKIEKYLPQ